jgi:CcmD family protein
VLIISLVVWLGVFMYLFRIERRVGKLEKELPKEK